MEPSVGSLDDLLNIEYISQEAWKCATQDPRNIQKYINKDDVVVRCRNSRCGRACEYEEAKHSFKSCFNCYTYYCSVQCRKEHWQSHKRKCTFARVNTLCKQVCVKAMNDSVVVNQLSQVAVNGWRNMGKGCVVLNLSSADTGQEFLRSGLQLVQRPYYMSVARLHKENQGMHLRALTLMCKQYNPEERFVLNVTVIPGMKRPEKQAASTYKGTVVKKCVKIWLGVTAVQKQFVKDSGLL